MHSTHQQTDILLHICTAHLQVTYNLLNLQSFAVDRPFLKYSIGTLKSCQPIVLSSTRVLLQTSSLHLWFKWELIRKCKRTMDYQILITGDKHCSRHFIVNLKCAIKIANLKLRVSYFSQLISIKCEKAWFAHIKHCFPTASGLLNPNILRYWN